MRKALALLAAIGIVFSAMSVPAQADADVVISVKILNKPDNGYGSPSHWADLTFTRTVIVHPVLTKFEVTVKDSGKFVTRKGAGSPNNDVTIARKLPGDYTSTVNYGLVDGTIDGNKVGDIDGNVYDVKAGVNPPGTGAWSKLLFEDGATSGAISSYQFLYKTLDEQWDERWNDGVDDRFDNNNDGQNATAGDITGRLTSKLSVVTKCRVSKTDKANRWTVSNVQGDLSRTFHYWLRYSNGTYAKGNAPVTVLPGSSVVVTTPAGGRITIRYWNGEGVEKRAYAYSNYGKTGVTCS